MLKVRLLSGDIVTIQKVHSSYKKHSRFQSQIEAQYLFRTSDGAGWFGLRERGLIFDLCCNKWIQRLGLLAEVVQLPSLC